ncbi:MAG: hypothetical protein ACHQ4G_01840 [Opitutales bacterium]
MVRFPFPSSTFRLAAGLLLVPAILPAQEETGKTPPAPPADTLPARHLLSANVSAALTASLPKYDPPKPVQKKPETDLVDQRDVDKPRNHIVRLPEYVVREKKPPVFREKDIYTDKGLSDIALKRYFSEAGLALNAFTLPLFGISKEAYAKMLYDQDERLNNMSDLKDSARDISLINPDNAKAIQQATQDTFDQSHNYNYQRSN